MGFAGQTVRRAASGCKLGCLLGIIAFSLMAAGTGLFVTTYVYASRCAHRLRECAQTRALASDPSRSCPVESCSSSASGPLSVQYGPQNGQISRHVGFESWVPLWAELSPRFSTPESVALRVHPTGASCFALFCCPVQVLKLHQCAGLCCRRTSASPSRCTLRTTPQQRQPLHPSCRLLCPLAEGDLHQATTLPSSAQGKRSVVTPQRCVC